MSECYLISNSLSMRIADNQNFFLDLNVCDYMLAFYSLIVTIKKLEFEKFQGFHTFPKADLCFS